MAAARNPVSRPKIEAAPSQQQAAALRLIFNDLPPESQTALVTTLLAGSAAGTLPMAGLLQARRGDEQVGAVWAQIQPGKIGALWPPKLTEGEDSQTALALLEAANDFLARHQVSLAQTLLENPRSDEAQLLQQAGYEHLTDLIYLVCTEAHFPSASPRVELEFEVYRDATRDRLAAVIEQTYEATHDCPTLNGVRSMDDVLTGYQTTGVFDPNHWRLVRHRGADIGCVLLADHPSADQFELVYMGLVPSARGQGFGVQVAKFAQYLTGEAGRPRLVLAVDAQNEPALKMYSAADFLRWEQRSVFLRVFHTAKAAAERPA